ncbi:TPA_asm: hypothetical protein GHL46_07265 [Listeria monocytogenes]|nr:hypothetical protein [Listeria monocytogenes]
MEKWNMYDLEKNRNKTIFLRFLNQLNDEKEFETLFRSIKASGVLIAYDFRKIDKAQFQKVINFLFQNLYTQFPNKVNKILEEVDILNQLRAKVFKKVDSIYSLLPKDKQAHYLSQYINNFFFERMNPLLHQQSNASDLSDLNEVMIMSFGMILKDMYRRKIPFTIVNDLNSHDSYLIGKHLEVATELRVINEIIETWMFGDIEIINNKDTQIVEINEIEDFGVNKLMCQIPFLDLKEAKNAMSNFFSFTQINNEKMDFSLEREELENKIQEYFYTNDFSQTYKNIPLYDWINSYWCLYEYSLRLIHDPKANSNIIYHSFEEWTSILINSGISPINVSSLLDYLTFTEKSKDLYDSPLIKFSNGLICIPNMIPFIDISQSLMSQFGISEDKKDSNLNQKGTNFENHIKTLTEQNAITTITNLKRNIGDEIYEIDLIFHLDGIIFFVESKTQKQPGTHRDFYRNQEEMSMYIKKFNRNVNYIANNDAEKQYIMKKLGLNSFKQIYKIFITNVYQTSHFIDGVYVIDEINYYCFMNRFSPKVNYIDNAKKEISSFNVDSHLYTGKMTAYQFLSMINNTNLNTRLSKRIGSRIVDLKEQQNLIYTCYYIETPSHQHYDQSISEEDIMGSLKNNYF